MSPRKANGHVSANGGDLSSPIAAAPNGHAELGQAGSDDASEFSAANAASASSTAGADRKATADLAESAAEGRFRAAGTASGSYASVSSQARTQPPAAPGRPMPEAHPKASTEDDTTTGSEDRFAAVPPGRRPLPVDGEAFVKAVHRQVDLVQVEVTLLRDPDPKIVQRELAYLRELRYGKRALITDDESRRILYDAPRPEREVQ